MNAAVEYVASHYERFGLDRLDVPRMPACVLLTPRFRGSRHVVAVLLGPDGQRAALVAKLPRLAGDHGSLAREARNLIVLERSLSEADRGTTPTLVTFKRDASYPLLLETALCGQPLSPAAVRRSRDVVVASVAGWLERLAVATLTTPTGDDWYERLVTAPLLAPASAADASVERMVEQTLERAEPLRSAGLPLVFEHGDLGHPNLLRQPDGRLGVLDWEHGKPAGLPAHDLFFFLAYAAVAVRQDPRAAFFGPTPWARQVAERYLRRLEIHPELLPPLLAVCCARAGSDRMALLWRRALGGDA